MRRKQAIGPLLWGFVSIALAALRPHQGSVKGSPRSPRPWAALTAPVSFQVALCTQVALGMEHLSNNRFVHKDLAARNCLVSAQRQVKVSALGLSKDVYNR